MLRSKLSSLILKRLLLAIILLLAASFVIFVGINLLPGDFASTYLGRDVSPEAVVALRHELGLDAPLMRRYAAWLAGLLQGDFGSSWASRTPVSDQLWGRIGNSLLLAFVASLIAIPLSLLLGLTSVLYRNRIPDRLINFFAVVSMSCPEFFMGYLVISLFAITLGVGVFPSAIYETMSLAEKLQTIWLPVTTLVLAVLPHMTRMTRAAVLNVMAAPYVETARLKGLRYSKVIAKHAAPNAASPIITVIALNVAALVLGVVVIEVVFVFPGVGQYMVDAVTVRDMPVVQACGIVFAAIYIFVNLCADVCAMLANPKLRYSR